MSVPTPQENDPLHACLFGSFRLTLPNGAAIDITAKRARALFAILCLTPGTSVDRTRLCQLLWQGRFQAQARASLRQTVLILKKQLVTVRPDLIEITRESITANPLAITTDLNELESALANNQADRACTLLMEIGGKKLLAGIDFGEEFKLWLTGRRHQIEQRLSLAIENTLDKLDHSAGKGAKAHRRLHEAWQLREATADATTQQIRIGVLPFQCSFTGPASTVANDSASSEPLQSPCQVFAQGLFDELMTSLGQIPLFKVTGRGSAMYLARSKALTVVEMAHQLGVDYLLQGSVLQENNETRVHVYLSEGQTGYECWSHRYRSHCVNLFALQEEMARTVCQKLGRRLGVVVGSPNKRQTTTSKSAYVLYLQGRALTARAIGEGVLEKATELLEEALAIDPKFAICWAALAEALVHIAVYTPCLDRLDKTQRMAECARKAIELDPHQGHARTLLGIWHWTRNDAVGALDLAHEALRLEPGNPEVVMRLGSFLLYIGRTREALPFIQQAVEQDPVNGRNYAMLCVAQLNLGNTDEAIEAGQRMMDLGLPSMWLAVAVAARGHTDKAVELYRQTRWQLNKTIFPPVGLKPLTGEELDSYWRVAAKGVCGGSRRHRQTYCAVLERLYRQLPDPADTSIVLPAIWMGYSEMVFKTLGKQITPANLFCLMSLWSDIDPIRQVRHHPDFMAFAKNTGLLAAWKKYGWPDLLPASPE